MMPQAQLPPQHPMGQQMLPPPMMQPPQIPPHSVAPFQAFPPQALPPQALPPQPKPPVIIAETPRFDGVPQNNRIFVDGRAYEVFYIGDTAVIEQNGLPHRIFFIGPPRDVVIDGTPHRLAFGEVTRVYIDGEGHNLRFGGPSRELYMGEHPFKGTFGGAPIYATINGRRHEIRLGGPAPEVRIEPDPSYELQRYMPDARKNVVPPPKVEPKEEPVKKEETDVFSFLRKLQQQGVLKPKPATPPPEPKPVVEEPPKSETPPIPAVYHFSSQRGTVPPENLLGARNTAVLTIRYSKVVESILNPPPCCPECGLSFEDLSDEIRTRHKDDHVQQKLKRLGGSSSMPGGSRPWYNHKKSFYECSTRAELLKVDQKKEEVENVDTARVSAVPAEKAHQKFCQACREDFTEYYDSDEDLWMYKDSALYNDMPYHTGCLMDASTISTHEETTFPSVNTVNMFPHGNLLKSENIVMSHH
ncbi:hypothetical protein L596_023477 [Steinernema carpocapsae]|uniref:PCFS4-like zinc finger domain-containing protein n=1 Tax=Steinernema carpocapsae TaxID=34508 RepID=A0A4U5MDT5_STECR|nr:hypothetical protein L596_023477 [Steinernema carpocapsae]